MYGGAYNSIARSVHRKGNRKRPDGHQQDCAGGSAKSLVDYAPADCQVIKLKRNLVDLGLFHARECSQIFNECTDLLREPCSC
jgi:hypothetical protein